MLSPKKSFKIHKISPKKSPKISPSKISPSINFKRRRWGDLAKKSFDRGRKCSVCIEVPYFRNLDDVREAITEYKSNNEWTHFPEVKDHLFNHEKSPIPYTDLTAKYLKDSDIIVEFSHKNKKLYFKNSIIERCGKPVWFKGKSILPKARHAIEKNLLEKARLNTCVKDKDNPMLCCGMCYNHAKSALKRFVASYHQNLVQSLFKMILMQTFSDLKVSDEMQAIQEEYMRVQSFYKQIGLDPF